MCGCFVPFLGLYLILAGETPFLKLLGFALLGMSLLGGWANRLGGRRRGAVFPGFPGFDFRTAGYGTRGPFGSARGSSPGGFPFPGGPASQPRPSRPAGLNDSSAAFFAILGILAKSDGKVSQSEINALDPLLPDDTPELRERAIAAFRRGRDGHDDLDRALRDLATGIGPGQVDGLFDLWCRVVLVDGEVSAGERATLLQIERRLFGTATRTEAFFRTAAGGRSTAGESGGRRSSAPRSEEDPHKVFGLPNPTTRSAIKKRYRELVKQHHPDRVRGRGMPDEAVKAAEVQMRKINIARDALLDRYAS